MTSKVLHIVAAALITVAYSIVLAHAAGPETSVSQMRKLEERVNRIKLFGASRDLAGLERAVDENLQDWEAGDPGDYGELMLAVVQTLASEPFDDARQYKLAQRYARLALEKAGQISLEAEVKLVRHVEADFVMPARPKGQAWAQQRTADLKLWFQAWKRLDDTIDDAWDPDDLPEANAVPPSAAGMPAGVVPEAIRDPRLRAEYEATIETNREKAGRYNEQYRARKLAKRFYPKAERYIVAAYSHPPFEMDELQDMLMKYMADKETRERIIETVRGNMNEAARAGQ